LDKIFKYKKTVFHLLHVWQTGKMMEKRSHKISSESA